MHLRTQNHPLTLSLEGHLKGGARALDTRKNHNFIYSGGSDGKIIQWRFNGTQWEAQEIVPDRVQTTTAPTITSYSPSTSVRMKSVWPRAGCTP